MRFKRKDAQTNPGEAALEFNLSHAGGVVLIAISLRRRIGVDVEKIYPMADLSTIAESHFSVQERAFIFRNVPAEREHAFFRCWTRKEAYIKAVGKGLSLALNSFDTVIAPGQSGRWLAGIPDSSDGAKWWLTDLNVPEGYMAAVAVEKGVDDLDYFEWPSVE